MKHAAMFLIASCLATIAGSVALADKAGGSKPIHIGSRLEPLIDDDLIDQRAGALELELHSPVRHSDAIVLDRPWEGNNSGYATILKHDDTFFFYYRGSGLVLTEGHVGGKGFATTCVMTSKDGIQWTRPKLGFVQREGWENNNIILTYDTSVKVDESNLDAGNDVLSGKKVKFTGGVHNFTPMIDTNPDCKSDEKFKALGGHDHRLLY